MPETPDSSADAERRLARFAAIGIPATTLAAALAVGSMMSLGPAILVAAAGTILGAIALLWASLRTLSGDAPLPLELEAMAARTRSVDDRAERKRRVLRALKDLELEHAVGKIDDKDYATLDARFRDEAKALMREMDEQIDPLREEAERQARKYLARRGLDDEHETPKKADEARERDGGSDEEKSVEKEEDVEEDVPVKKPKQDARVSCPKCATSNEPDAAFCKKCGTSLKADADAST